MISFVRRMGRRLADALADPLESLKPPSQMKVSEGEDPSLARKRAEILGWMERKGIKRPDVKRKPPEEVKS